MPPGPHQAPGSLAWCRHLTPPKLAGPPRSVCDRGCSALGSPGGPMCEGGAPSFPPGPSQGQLRSGMAAALSETTMVLIFLASAWVRSPAG